MDSETGSTTCLIKPTRRERILNRIWFGYNALNFLATFGLYISTLIVAVTVLKKCFIVGLVVLIIGTVLGLIQLVPEFFRNFIKLQPKSERNVNYFFFFVLAVRTIWLILATVIVTESQCKDINYAWISIYVNWGIFVGTAAIVSIVVIVRILRARHETQKTLEW